METLTGIVTQLIHMALIVAGAPVLLGLVRLAKARLMGRRGPHPLQPWRDIAKLLAKRAVVAETASAVTHVATWVALSAALLAAFLIPSFARGMVLAPLADLLLVAVVTWAGDIGRVREPDMVEPKLATDRPHFDRICLIGHRRPAIEELADSFGAGQHLADRGPLLDDPPSRLEHVLDQRNGEHQVTGREGVRLQTACR